MTLQNLQSSLLRLAKKDNWLFQTTKEAKPLFQLTTYIVAVICGGFPSFIRINGQIDLE